MPFFRRRSGADLAPEPLAGPAGPRLAARRLVGVRGARRREAERRPRRRGGPAELSDTGHSLAVVLRVNVLKSRVFNTTTESHVNLHGV